jgi:hypothetical protein
MMTRSNVLRVGLAGFFLINILVIPRRGVAATQNVEYPGVQCQLTKTAVQNGYTGQIMTEGYFIDNVNANAPAPTFICPAIVVTPTSNISISDITLTQVVTMTDGVTPLGTACTQIVDTANGTRYSVTLSGVDHGPYDHAERIFFYCWTTGTVNKMYLRGYKVNMTYAGL